ncbi:hypothetical protein MUCCIDRAFT_104250 [Mucor lusitanicus CBS 277.49]|uniref:Uncharacterized protein n=2 Tax=Mucor circinelloides f. lusitanicus TaxID=29924 RepID=A0A162R185_MUCCL|nr:hypothetical protein MUCCIDRAFT_104250 [Mucor lusitanicus CBS 277.49]
MLLIESSLKGPTCVGEVKGEDRKDDTYLSAFDLLKIASFSKEAIDNKQYQGVLGVPVVGLQINFYVTTLLAEGLHVMLELASVPIPSSVHDMKAFTAI